VETIQLVKRALTERAKYDKSFNPTVAFDEIKANYLAQTLGKRSTISPEDPVVGTGLWKELNTEKQARMFNILFDPQEREAIKTFARAAELAQVRSGKGAGMGAMALQSIGTGMAIYPWFYDHPGGAAVAAVGTGIMLSPKVLAKIMTNKKLVDNIVAVASRPQPNRVKQALVESILPLGGRLVSAQGRAVIEDKYAQEGSYGH
jgi:hypothetical protein